MVAAARLHRHVGRKRTGRFLAEGPNLVEAALAGGFARELFATESAATRFATLLAGADVPVHKVTERAAKALSDTVTPVGLVAVCESRAVTVEDVIAARPGSVVVGVGISEPGNAGTLIRLADALGAGAVVLAGHSVDPYNAKCLRASAGSAFTVPVIVEPDPAAVIGALREAGLQVLATTTDGETTSRRCRALVVEADGMVVRLGVARPPVRRCRTRGPAHHNPDAGPCREPQRRRRGGHLPVPERPSATAGLGRPAAAPRRTKAGERERRVHQ